MISKFWMLETLLERTLKILTDEDNNENEKRTANGYDDMRRG